MDHLSPDHSDSMYGKLLIIILGAIIGGTGSLMDEVHMGLAVILQITGLITFIIYFLTNWTKMKSEYKKFMRREKRGNKKREA